MNFGEINELIQADIPALTQKREVYRAINRVIRDINSKFPGKLHTETGLTCHHASETLTLTFDAIGQTISDDALGDFSSKGYAVGDKIYISGSALNDGTYTIKSFSAASLIDIDNDNSVVAESSVSCSIVPYLVTTDYTWDNVNKELTLPEYVKEVIEVFENGVELENRGYEYTKDSDNSSENIFTFVNRKKIALPTKLMDAASDIFEVKMLKDLDLISSDASSTDVDIPQQLDQTLISGVMMYLLAKPKYKDPDLFAINKDAYDKGLKDAETLEIQRFPSTKQSRTYIY